MAELCFNTMNHSAWFGIRSDLEAQARAAAAAGFRWFGPDVFSIEQHGDPERLAAHIEAAGLRCFEVAALTIDASPLDAQLDALERAVRALRPSWVLTNVDVPPDVAAEPLRRAADRLGEAGARLAIEFLPFTAARSIGDALEAIDRAGLGDRAGMLLDTWHFFNGPDDWRDLEELPLERIAYLQLDDHVMPAAEPLHESTVHDRVMPGEGSFDLPRVAATLRDKGFDGMISVEILSRSWREGDLDAFARACHESSARFWPGAS